MNQGERVESEISLRFVQDRAKLWTHHEWICVIRRNRRLPHFVRKRRHELTELEDVSVTS